MEILNSLFAEGNGNIFILIEIKDFEEGELKALHDKYRNEKYDQLIIFYENGKSKTYMRIINADSSEVLACGNGTRVLGKLLLNLPHNQGQDSISIFTYDERELICHRYDGNNVLANIGTPKMLNWKEIPLSEEIPTLPYLPKIIGNLALPIVVNMGNPHAVFILDDKDDLQSLPIEHFGPIIEHHDLFPERTNVEFVKIISDTGENSTQIDVNARVWERGANETQACGTGACAILASLNFLYPKCMSAIIHFPGGPLYAEFRNGDIYLAGDIHIKTVV